MSRRFPHRTPTSLALLMLRDGIHPNAVAQRTGLLVEDVRVIAACASAGDLSDEQVAVRHFVWQHI